MVSRGGAIPDVVLPAIPAVVLAVLFVVLVAPVAAVVALRVLRFEDDRCRREGVGWLAPSIPLCDVVSVPSGTPVEVEDVVETTEAVC